MRRLRHPRTGQIRRRARDSLFALLVGAVTLSTVLEFLLSHLQTSQPRDVVWWGGLVGAVLLGIGLVYGTAIWDDRRIGRDETRIELLLPYMVRKEGQQVELGRRGPFPGLGDKPGPVPAGADGLLGLARVSPGAHPGRPGLEDWLDG